MNSIYSEFLKLKRSMSRDPRIPGLARRAQESNWNALMSRPALTSEIVLGKVAASMQLVLLVTVIGLGKLALGLEGVFPAKYLLGSLLIHAGLRAAGGAAIGVAGFPVLLRHSGDHRAGG